MPKDNNIENAFVQEDGLYNKNIKPAPVPKTNIGIDVDGEFYNNIIQAGEHSQLDTSALNEFSNVSQSRDRLYNLIDTMGNDSMIAAALETYAEDSTEYSDQGRIMWAESSNPEVSKFVNYLLDTMNVDKNIYKWAFYLCKYGDVYLRLFRESDMDNSILFGDKDDKTSLNEDINVRAYSKRDHYTHYVEMIQNPACMFELVKNGKTQAYIKADVNSLANSTPNSEQQILNNYYQYRVKRNDIDVFEATEFVHGCLEDSYGRVSEEVKVFLTEEAYDKNSSKREEAATYSVKRGQSILYNTFQVWRLLKLLENSVLLNRLTKSSVVRVIGVEVGDMSKEMVGPHLQGIKSLMENKTAIDAGNSMQSYTNPGPVENNIYVPTHEGVGALNIQSVGGDFNAGQLTDLDYFNNKLFGALRIPKQYFGFTDDGAGFSGGESLAIISSRYAKMIKRIQNTLVQMMTDAVNLMLLDKGRDNFVNQFTIKMQSPTTKEESDRRENTAGKIQLTSDIMNMLNDVPDASAKLKILKELLSNVLSNEDITTILQDQIDKLEQEESPIEEEQTVEEFSEPTSSSSSEPSSSFDLGADLGLDQNFEEPEESTEQSETMSSSEEISNEESLPSPAELDIGDLSDNNNENI